MKLKNIFKKKDKTNTGIKNIKKQEFKGEIYYHYTKEKQVTVMSDLDFLLKSLENKGEDIIIENEDLFNKSILESRMNSYQYQCDVYNVI